MKMSTFPSAPSTFSTKPPPWSIPPLEAPSPPMTKMQGGGPNPAMTKMQGGPPAFGGPPPAPTGGMLPPLQLQVPEPSKPDDSPPVITALPPLSVMLPLAQLPSKQPPPKKSDSMDGSSDLGFSPLSTPSMDMDGSGKGSGKGGCAADGYGKGPDKGQGKGMAPVAKMVPPPGKGGSGEALGPPPFKAPAGGKGAVPPPPPAPWDKPLADSAPGALTSKASSFESFVAPAPKSFDLPRSDAYSPAGRDANGVAPLRPLAEGFLTKAGGPLAVPEGVASKSRGAPPPLAALSSPPGAGSCAGGTAVAPMTSKAGFAAH